MMMNKFALWFERNRRPIGYTVGGLNLLAAVNHLVSGHLGLAVLWLVIGSFIVYDTRTFR